jgi:hypothetical protein
MPAVSRATVEGRVRWEQFRSAASQIILTMSKEPTMAAMGRRKAGNEDDIMVGYFRVERCNEL